MDIRKVQVTGGSSYIITIPKEWARTHGLKKNDPLGMISQPDGSLLVTTKTTGVQSHRTKDFEIGDVKRPSYILRLLIGAYIAGYDVINVNTTKRSMPKVRSLVRDFTHLTIGQEIVEETSTSIKVKDLLNPSEMPFDRTLRRMLIIIKSMHEDAIAALRSRNASLTHDVRARDNEVDRLHWLIARQFNLLLREISLVEKMKVSVETAHTYYLVSRIMERIGDHSVRIARYARKLIEKKVGSKTIEKIRSASSLSVCLFNRSVESLFTKDIMGSNENINDIGRAENLCDEINGLALKYKGTTALAISSIAGSIRRVAEYSANISENVINHLVLSPEF